MIRHIYPPWHKPAQRFLFALGAIILITLPAVYGTTDAISSEALALILALYFGFWFVFSLVVRFAIPSPRVESTLPTYTHAPVPTPVLHTPKKNAVPAAPAIRVYSSESEILPGHDDPHQQSRKKKSARLILIDGDNYQGEGQETSSSSRSSSDSIEYGTKDSRHMNETKGAYDNVHVYTPTIAISMANEDDDQATTHPGPPPPTPSVSNGVKKSNLNVTFEHNGRPQHQRLNSGASDTFPTYAAYRQAQHGSFDTFAQRIRRALTAAAATVKTAPEPASPGPSSSSSPSSSSLSPAPIVSDSSDKNLPMSSISTSNDHLYPPPLGSGGARVGAGAGPGPGTGAGTGAGAGSGTTPQSGRSRSTSAASVLSDIAERFRAGTLLFSRSLSRSHSLHSGFRQHVDEDEEEGEDRGREREQETDSSHEEGGSATVARATTTVAMAASTHHTGKTRSRAVSDAATLSSVAGARHQGQDGSTILRSPELVRSHSALPDITITATATASISTTTIIGGER
ncbi:hypothetical protein DFQ26_003902 [Actinomortierella ambigua]|nr:hypothetical protein DFQ26_003902 [Actinomortierella ambigua]